MCQILNKKIRIKLINIDKTNRRAFHWNLYKQQQQLRQAKEDMLNHLGGVFYYYILTTF